MHWLTLLAVWISTTSLLISIETPLKTTYFASSLRITHITASFQSFHCGKQLGYSDQSSAWWIGTEMKIGGFESCRSFIRSPNSTQFLLCHFFLSLNGVRESAKRLRIQLCSQEPFKKFPSKNAALSSLNFYFPLTGWKTSPPERKIKPHEDSFFHSLNALSGIHCLCEWDEVDVFDRFLQMKTSNVADLTCNLWKRKTTSSTQRGSATQWKPSLHVFREVTPQRGFAAYDKRMLKQPILLEMWERILTSLRC